MEIELGDKGRKWIELSNRMVKDGRAGLNKGYPYSISSLNKYLNITPGDYYLYGAQSNVGKSSVVYGEHIFNITLQYLKALGTGEEIDFEIDLYTPEIDPGTILGKARLYYLFLTRKILTTTSYLFSKRGMKLSEAMYKELYSPEVNRFITILASKINFYTYVTTNSLKQNTKRYLQRNGNLRLEGDIIVEYTPTNPKKIYQIIIDHVGIMTPINGESLKRAIDTASSFLYSIRKITKAIPVVIQQINPDKNYTPEQRITPSHQDLRDTKNTYQDADVMISIGSPFKENIVKYLDYDIVPTNRNPDALANRFRLLRIAKNRDGDINIVIPTLFLGEIALFSSLPNPDELNYEKYSKLVAITE